MIVAVVDTVQEFVECRAGHELGFGREDMDMTILAKRLQGRQQNKYDGLYSVYPNCTACL